MIIVKKKLPNSFRLLKVAKFISNIEGCQNNFIGELCERASEFYLCKSPKVNVYASTIAVHECNNKQGNEGHQATL